MIRQALPSLGILALLCTPAFADKSEDDLKALEGTWLPSSGEVAGAALPEEELKKIKLVIRGNAYTVTADSKEGKGTIKLDASKSPKQMDVTGTEGANKDKTFPAIYEMIDKDTFKACYALVGDRPTEFKSTGDYQTMLTFKRAKP